MYGHPDLALLCLVTFVSSEALCSIIPLLDLTPRPSPFLLQLVLQSTRLYTRLPPVVLCLLLAGPSLDMCFDRPNRQQYR
jgi:hypothetical protein